MRIPVDTCRVGVPSHRNDWTLTLQPYSPPTKARGGEREGSSQVGLKGRGVQYTDPTVIRTSNFSSHGQCLNLSATPSSNTLSSIKKPSPPHTPYPSTQHTHTHTIYTYTLSLCCYLCLTPGRLRTATGGGPR